MFWKRPSKTDKQFPLEVTCCKAFEEALKRLEQNLEDAETQTPKELHIAWQREQKGLSPLKDESHFLADLFNLPLTSDRHIHANFALKDLWKQREEFNSVKSNQVTGVLEHREKGRYFDHGDSDFVEAQIRLKDGTVRFTAIELMDRHLFGKQVSGMVTGVAFVQDEKSKRRNARPFRGTSNYTSRYEPPKEEKEPVDNRPFKPWKGRSHSYTRR